MLVLKLLTSKVTITLAVIVALASIYWLHRGQLLNEGYQKAVAQYQAADADYQREVARETARLIELTRKNQDAYRTQGLALQALHARVAALTGRLQVRDADFEARVSAATADALRRYAQTVDGDFGRCIADVGRLGAEAAECSRTAHALKSQLDLLTCH